MQQLDQQFKITQQTFAAFNEALAMPFNNIVRDASIKRFEFTSEAVWKLAQLYLREREGLEFNSPKMVFRGLFQTSILNEAQTQLTLEMIDERSLSMQSYNEALAQKIYPHMQKYRDVMETIITSIAAKINSPVS